MKLLALETTGKYGSAAVIDEEGRVCTVSSSGEMNHLTEIIEISDAAIRQAGITKADLTHVAASAGPGSFTGIRIGVTVARTLGQVLNIPCVAVSSLEAMAVNVYEAALAAGCDSIGTIINARRHQTYAGVWTIKGQGTGADAEDSTGTGTFADAKQALEQRQYMIEELLEAIKSDEKTFGRVYFTGDGVDAYESIIKDALAEGSYVLAPEEIRYQTAETVAIVARGKAKSGDATGYEDLKPEYMRLSEAEQRLRDGTLSAKIRKQVQI